ncbi:MAG: hypothetical protein P8X64_08105 [Anaerolineales bacterium]
MNKLKLPDRTAVLFFASILIASLACGSPTPTPASMPPTDSPQDATRVSAFARGRTAYGFFPSPPDSSFESILDHFEALHEHADFILFQPNVPWIDFVDGTEGESASREERRNVIALSRRFGLDWIFVIDPLNGLNRSEFYGLPEGWKPAFSNPDVRAAFTNFTLWVVREFQPSYLGLASEINTYLDAHPDDAANYLSLYRDVYDRVKAEAPDTQIFVTFQWDDLNNMFEPASEGRPAYQTNWDQVEAFEPRLDLWVISSYPFFIYPGDAGILDGYYTPLLGRTEKPLAVAEGGWSTEPVGPLAVDEAGQVAYLQALHEQLGERLVFWTYLLLDDLNMDWIGPNALEGGMSESDLETLNHFAHIGLRHADGEPKPALALWDAYRGDQ